MDRSTCKIEDQSYDNYNEGVRLQASAERYKDRFGHYPKAILTDTSYRNRENRAFCKERGIRLSGPKLGRPRKEDTDESRSEVYQDSCDRNMVEGRNGIGKRRYGLDLIMAYLAETGKTEAAFIILATNVAHLLRFFFSSFLAHAEDRKMDWRIGWHGTGSCVKEHTQHESPFSAGLKYPQLMISPLFLASFSCHSPRWLPVSFAQSSASPMILRGSRER